MVWEVSLLFIVEAKYSKTQCAISTCCNNYWQELLERDTRCPGNRYAEPVHTDNHQERNGQAHYSGDNNISPVGGIAFAAGEDEHKHGVYNTQHQHYPQRAEDGERIQQKWLLPENN